MHAINVSPSCLYRSADIGEAVSFHLLLMCVDAAANFMPVTGIVQRD
jgi:hypothetical protein